MQMPRGVRGAATKGISSVGPQRSPPVNLASKCLAFGRAPYPAISAPSPTSAWAVVTHPQRKNRAAAWQDRLGCDAGSQLDG